MIELRQIQQGDEQLISNAFLDQGWNKPVEQYLNYIERNNNNEIITILAFYDGEFAGYGNLFYKSDYIEFQEQNIPEVVDLNTLIKFRGKGIATAIMNELEKRAFETSSKVGIGVGLIKDYGPAQAMYAKRGYVPNAKGIYYNDKNIGYFDSIQADDSLVLYMVKKKER